MVIRKFLFCLLAVAGNLLTAGQALAEATASVDRSAIAENDIISLTLRSTKGDISSQLDLSRLQQAFTVLNQQRSSQISIVNGARTANYDLILVIAPNRSGTLTIPAFNLNGERTQPIDIRVTPGSANPQQELSDVFIDNQVDKQEVYVQEQIIYTLRIFHSVGLSEANLTPLEIANTDIQQLGEQRKYETIIKGIRYSVIEVKYALFPEQSGRLEIPEQALNARTLSRSGSIFRNNGKYVRVRSATHIINVKPIPASYPAGSPWIPSAKLTIEDSWSVRTPDFFVGEPVTRTFNLSAEGVNAAQLPDLIIAPAEGIKTYPDQPQSNDQVSDRGLVGQRSQATAIVPAREGVIELPPSQIVWWNTETDKLETTEVAEYAIDVLPAPQDSLNSQLPLPAQSPDVVADSALAGNAKASWLWPAAAAVFALLWLLTLVIWWQTRRQKPKPKSSTGVADDLSLQQAYRNLRNACQQNDAGTARSALLTWFKKFAAPRRIQTLEDIKRTGPTELGAALDELEAHLYGQRSDPHWQGASLLNAVKQAQNEAKNTSGEQASPAGLKPLYPL